MKLLTSKTFVIEIKDLPVKTSYDRLHSSHEVVWVRQSVAVLHPFQVSGFNHIRDMCLDSMSPVLDQRGGLDIHGIQILDIVQGLMNVSVFLNSMFTREYFPKFLQYWLWKMRCASDEVGGYEPL